MTMRNDTHLFPSTVALMALNLLGSSATLGLGSQSQAAAMLKNAITARRSTDRNFMAKFKYTKEG